MRSGPAPTPRSPCSTRPAWRSRTSRSARRSMRAGARATSRRRSSASESGCPTLLLALLGCRRPMSAVLLLALLRLLVGFGGGAAAWRRRWKWAAVRQDDVVKVIELAGPVGPNVGDHRDSIARPDQRQELFLCGPRAGSAGVWADGPGARRVHDDEEVVIGGVRGLRDEAIQVVGAGGEQEELRRERRIDARAQIEGGGAAVVRREEWNDRAVEGEEVAVTWIGTGRLGAGRARVLSVKVSTRIPPARLEARARGRVAVVLALQPALVVPVERVVERGGARRCRDRQRRRDCQQHDDADGPDSSLRADPSAHDSIPGRLQDQGRPREGAIQDARLSRC